MKKHLLLKALLAATFITSSASAKSPFPLSKDTIVIKQHPHVRKFFIGTALDAGIFSSASIEHTYYNILGEPIGTKNSMGTLRFTYVINFGVTFNYNPSRFFGLYTGLDLKNVGYIEKNDFTGQRTYKRRTYNLGIPVGIKIGNMADRKSYGFLGAGIDAPFNYREKTFTVRNQKTKYNEWFSDATPNLMPYVFAGVAIRRGISIKAQYYLNNYLNPDYVRNGYKPNEGTTVHLMLLSLGFTSPFGKNPDMIKKRVTDLNTSSM